MAFIALRRTVRLLTYFLILTTFMIKNVSDNYICRVMNLRLWILYQTARVTYTTLLMNQLCYLWFKSTESATDCDVPTLLLGTSHFFANDLLYLPQINFVLVKSGQT